MDHSIQTEAGLPDITTTLPDLLPQLRRITTEGWVLSVVTVVLAGIVMFFLTNGGQSFSTWIAFPPGVAFVLVTLIVLRTRRGHEAVIMPILAQSVGMSYSPNAKTFATTLPDRLLPKCRLKKGEDLISGMIGARKVQFAEVKYETGGKNSTVLFGGVVMAFQNAAPMPPFFMAAENQTKGWFVFKGNLKVDDLVPIRNLNGADGQSYGVWASPERTADHPGLDAVLSVLTGLQDLVGSGSTLFSATSDGTEMHVALRHKRDLFRIGGMFATEPTMIDQIRRAYDDLTLPLKIAGKLLDAEAAVAKVEL